MQNTGDSNSPNSIEKMSFSTVKSVVLPVLWLSSVGTTFYTCFGQEHTIIVAKMVELKQTQMRAIICAMKTATSLDIKHRMSSAKTNTTPARQ